MPDRSKPPLLPRELPPTPRQVLGPYFVIGAPWRTRLFPIGAAGEKIRVSGQVVSTTRQPIPDALIHVWIADPEGRYDNQDEQGNTVPTPLSELKYRGRLLSNKQGKYHFTCLRPGNYFDTGWKLWRPAHIHIRVQASGYKTLTTQLYFQDDAHNRDDIPGDDFYQPELALQLDPALPVPGARQRATFNFVLEPEPKKTIARSAIVSTK